MQITKAIPETKRPGKDFGGKVDKPGPQPVPPAVGDTTQIRVGMDLHQAIWDAGVKNVSLRPRAEALLKQIDPVLLDASKLLADADALFLERVREQHRAARAEGVRQQAICDDLEADLPLVQRELEQLDAKRARAGQELAAALEAVKRVPIFASDAQIRAAEKRVSEAYAAQDRAVTAHAEAARDYRGGLMPAIAREKQKLEAIAERVADLAAVIAGQPVNKLGLPVADSRSWYAGEQSHGPHAA